MNFFINTAPKRLEITQFIWIFNVNIQTHSLFNIFIDFVFFFDNKIYILTKKTKIEKFEALISSFDYKKILKRGYAIIRGDKKIISSKNDAFKEKEFLIEFSDGKIKAKAEK